jgi:hypothetical protein
MKEVFSRDKTDNLMQKEDILGGKRGQLLENKGQVSRRTCAISQL